MMADSPWRTKEEFLKSLSLALDEAKPFMTGQAKKGNAQEVMAEWDAWLAEDLANE